MTYCAGAQLEASRRVVGVSARALAGHLATTVARVRVIEAARRVPEHVEQRYIAALHAAIEERLARARGQAP